MITALVLGELPDKVQTVEIAQWHVGEGDHVEFGAPLCRLERRTVQVFDREYAAAKGLQKLRMRLDGRVAVQVRPAPSPLHLQVLAAEAGVVRRLEQPVGAEVGPGSRLAVMAGDADEPVTGELDAVPGFRCTVDLDADLVEGSGGSIDDERRAH